MNFVMDGITKKKRGGVVMEFEEPRMYECPLCGMGFIHILVNDPPYAECDYCHERFKAVKKD